MRFSIVAFLAFAICSVCTFAAPIPAATVSDVVVASEAIPVPEVADVPLAPSSPEDLPSAVVSTLVIDDSSDSSSSSPATSSSTDSTSPSSPETPIPASSGSKFREIMRKLGENIWSRDPSPNPQPQCRRFFCG